MKNLKLLFPFFLFAGFLFSVFYYVFSQTETELFAESHIIIKKKIVICPTYHYLASVLPQDNYSFNYTEASSDSFRLLSLGQADCAISGRNLKASEGHFYSKRLENDHFSFFSTQELAIKESDFNQYVFYTDLPVATIKNNFNIENVVQVENVYDYLEKGIVISTWENTNYAFALPVHVFDANNNRLPKSRALTIYCQHESDLNELYDYLK